MRSHQAIVLLLLILVVRTSGTPAQNASPSDTPNKDTSVPMRFVRQFSSAQDVKGKSHPALNRSLDIIAGRKEAAPTIDALQYPFAITTDSSHRIFITDPGAQAVHIFDFVHSKYSLLRDGDRLRWPLGIATDRDGDFYVSDNGGGNIRVYDPNGKIIPYLKASRRHESYFESPWGVAVDEVTGRIYVCDASRHMVIVLDKSGRVLDRFGVRGGGREPGQFRYPTQVATAGTEIVVLDNGNSRVQILDAKGHFIRQIQLPPVNKRAGLAIDKNRNIYVSDPELNHLTVFSYDGKLLYEFGERGNQPGQFYGVSGLWVDSGQCLYVVDTQNKRVQLFQIDGPDSTGCQELPR
jgi:DNA-binding beta-propeller fold protein YncE